MALGCAGKLAARGERRLALLQHARIDSSGLAIADVQDSAENAARRQLASLLAYEHFEPTGEILHESLATAGVDARSQRLKNSDGRVHAKTGTMHGCGPWRVTSTGSGARYAFA